MENLSKNDFPMIRPVDISANTEQTLVRPLYNELKGTQSMIYPEPYLDKVHQDMVMPIFDDKKPKMVLQDNLYDSSIVHQVLVKNIVENTSKMEQQMVRLDDTDLAKKIQVLTRLDTSNLDKAPMQQLVSLVEIMENTVKELNMKLVENRPKIPKHVHQKMVSIEQPPYKQYEVHKYKEVDEIAKRRALKQKNGRKYEEKDYVNTNNLY